MYNGILNHKCFWLEWYDIDADGGGVEALESTILYNFGKKAHLLPKLYLSLQRNQSTSEDVYSKTNIGVCGMA